MTTTPLYELEKIDYSTTGWNGIVSANMDKIEAYLGSRFLVTLGESVEKHEAVYLDPADGKAYKAKAIADGSKQPALGLAVDPGDLDEQIRLQRVGIIQDSNWSFSTGVLYFLSQNTAGALTSSALQTVTDEQFTAASAGSYVSLANGAIELHSETVTSLDGNTTYTRGADYELDYTLGRITILSGGNMTGATDYLIDYEYSQIGERPQVIGLAVGIDKIFVLCGLNDLGYVHIIGNEEIKGLKSFSTPPQLSEYVAPTNDTQFVPKKYIDQIAEELADAGEIDGTPVDSSSLENGAALIYNEYTGNLEYRTPHVVSTSKPTPNDDGYIIGTTWVFNEEVYFCIENTTEKAKWKAISGNIIKRLSELAISVNNTQVTQGQNVTIAASNVDQLAESIEWNIDGSYTVIDGQISGSTQEYITVEYTADGAFNVYANQISSDEDIYDSLPSNEVSIYVGSYYPYCGMGIYCGQGIYPGLNSA